MWFALEDLDFENLEKVLEEVTEGKRISFQELVQSLMQGEYADYGIKDWILQAVLGEWQANREIFFLLLGVGIASAVFYQIASAFINKQIAETAFYLTYLIFLTTSAAGFGLLVQNVGNCIEKIKQFMDVLVPCFFGVVSMSYGSVTAAGYYQVTVLIMALINGVLLRVALPAVKIAVVLQMVNRLTKEEMISKLAAMVGQVAGGCMKGMLAVIIGLNTLEGLLLPTIDKVKLNSLGKVVGMVPGIGGSAQAVAGIVAGTGTLVRNAVGVAACVVLFVIISLPVLQTVIFIVTYRVLAVCLEPVADKRLSGAVEEVGKGGGMLLQAIVTAVLLFLITIAVVCVVAR
ncbi:MAG: stage III sporulation protein AE [Lachnospiraceae bacterium]|nr:stage III sporulation protein AE [Lachnospiraceae bacterium]